MNITEAPVSMNDLDAAAVRAGLPTYTDLLGALCDLAYDPTNHVARLKASALIQMVPIGPN